MTTIDQQSSSETAVENRIGPAPDRDEIIRVVRLYTDGMGAHDPAVFREAFHDAARIAYTKADGEFHEAPISEVFEAFADWPAPVTGHVIALIQAGDVATVVLGFDTDGIPAETWLDIHSLLRVDGIWKITNKTATHASRAGWAGAGREGGATGGAQTPSGD